MWPTLAALALALAHPPPGPAFRLYGPPAFAEAVRLDRPVALVLRDAACVSCAEENRLLQDPEVRGLLDRGFVSVIVEAWERPDVADLSALSLERLGVRSSGLGTSILLLTPRGRVFAARHGAGGGDDGDLRGFLMRHRSEFERDRAALESQAARVAAALRSAQESAAAPGPVSPAHLAAALRHAREAAPPSATQRLLLLTQVDLRGDAGVLPRMGSMPATPALSMAEAAQHLHAAALLARASGEPARREDALRQAVALAQRMPGEGGVPEGRDGVAADLGVTIASLARTAQALDAPALLAAAQRLARALPSALGNPSALRHRAGTEWEATLDDHAHVAFALLTLDDVSGTQEHRDFVVRLVDAALGRFADPRGGALFLTAEPTEPFGIRVRSIRDGRLPAGNATLVRVLRRLADVTGETRYRDLAARALEALSPWLASAPGGMATTALAALEALPEDAAAAIRASPDLRSTIQHGAVRFEASLERASLRRGEDVTAQVRLVVGPGASVVAPSATWPLFAFALSVPGPLTPAGAPRYPPSAEVPASGDAPAFRSFQGESTIHVPLRVPRDAAGGAARLLLRCRFQPCRGALCSRPETVTLAVPFTVRADP